MTLHLPTHRGWTSAQDADLRRLYDERPASWRWMGTLLDRNASTCRDRAIALGIHAGRERCSGEKRAAEKRINSEPLPAGHPISWTMLTRGTTLEGAGYWG